MSDPTNEELYGPAGYASGTGPWQAQAGVGVAEGAAEGLLGYADRVGKKQAVYDTLGEQIAGLGSQADEWTRLKGLAAQQAKGAGAAASGDMSRAMVAGGPRNPWAAQQSGIDAGRARSAAMREGLAAQSDLTERINTARGQEQQMRSEVAGLQRDERTEQQVASDEIALGDEVLYGIDGVGGVSHIDGVQGARIDPSRDQAGNWMAMHNTIVARILPEMTTQAGRRYWTRMAAWLKRRSEVGATKASEYVGYGSGAAYGGTGIN